MTLSRGFFGGESPIKTGELVPWTDLPTVRPGQDLRDPKDTYDFEEEVSV